MLMTGCDLSGSTKPWDCHNRVINSYNSKIIIQLIKFLLVSSFSVERVL